MHRWVWNKIAHTRSTCRLNEMIYISSRAMNILYTFCETKYNENKYYRK